MVALSGWASRPLRASSKINASMGNTRTSSASHRDAATVGKVHEPLDYSFQRTL